MRGEFPSTVAELVRSATWMARLQRLVESFRLGEDAEDTLAEAILMMVQSTIKGVDYVGRWDPSRSSFATWIYVPVRNLCRRKWQRENTRAGRALKSACSLVESYTEDEDASVGPCALVGVPPEQEHAVLGLDLMAVLESLPKEAFSCVEYGTDHVVETTRTGRLRRKEFVTPTALVGKRFYRSEREVFRLLAQGFTPEEIAVVLQTSATFVRTLIARLRENSMLAQLHKVA